MSITWLKLDHNIITDVKLRRFNSKEKWAWITLLCLASQNEDDRGVVKDELEDIADLCDYGKQDFQYLLDKFKTKGMIEFSAGQIKIINWEKFASPERCSSHPYRKYQDFVFKRDGYKCVYCGTGDNLTLDHQVPQSRGGSHEPENLVACCATCNSKKGARTPQEWMEAI
jgi:hypothetical protein